MSKSAIYTVQSSIPEVSDGDIIPLGTIIRRYGCNLRQDGNAISLCGNGYYRASVVVTLESATAAPIRVSIEKDGVELIGAFTEITLPATTVAPFPITSPLIRNTCGTSNLAVRVTGADVKVVNMIVTVEKI